MTDEQKEEQTSEENQEEETSEETPQEESSEDTDKLKKERDSAIKQKEHYRKKYEGVQNALSEDKEQADTKQEKTEIDDKMDFLLNNMGKEYAKDDIELISKKAKMDGVSMDKAAEDEDIKSIIETRHSKKQKDEETIEPSSPTVPQPDKPISELIKEGKFKEYEDKVNKSVKGV